MDNKDIWQEIERWPKTRFVDTSEYLEAIRNFLPEAADEQFDFLWNRALEEKGSGDSERIHWAESSMRVMLEFATKEQVLRYMEGMELDSFWNRFAAPKIIALYGQALEGKGQREVFRRAWQEAMRSTSRKEDFLVWILSRFDEDTVWEIWEEILNSYENNQWNGDIYHLDLNRKNVSGYQTFEILRSIASVIPEAKKVTAIEQICDLKHFSAHPYRRASVLRKLIAGDDKAARNLRSVFEKLLLERTFTDERDPQAIAAEVLLILPEELRGEGSMASLVYSVRKSVTD